MTRRALFIAGRPVDTGEMSPVRNPYNGEVLSEVCLGGEKEIEEAIRAAVKAFETSRRLPSHKRATALQKIAADLTQRHEEFSSCLSAESGKPITDARREVGRAISTFTIAAEEAKRIPGELVPLDISPGTDRHLGLVRRFPIGDRTTNGGGNPRQPLVIVTPIGSGAPGSSRQKPRKD